MLTRYVMNEVASMAVGPIVELAPDLTIVSAPDKSGVAEVDPMSVQGILFVDAADMSTGVIVILTPELKANLVRALTGGIEVAGAMPQLPGGLRGL